MWQLPLIEKLAPGQEWAEGPRGVIDEFMHASTPEAVVWANRIAADEGLLVGPSSGAAVHHPQHSSASNPGLQ